IPRGRRVDWPDVCRAEGAFPRAARAGADWPAGDAGGGTGDASSFIPRQSRGRAGDGSPRSAPVRSVIMKAWIISLVCGVAAGVLYALLDVHSPAPPVVALLGLFGMLVGEQLIPIGRRLVSREPLTLAWFRHECVPKISGTAPPAPAKESRDA